MMSEKSVFWADKKAEEIISREKYNYIDRKIPGFKEYVVKTSASISGVLHIGRLSDTIRGASVHEALLAQGVKSRLIWVAEDMDPLRKIPKGVPASYSKYIGMPITDIPDPYGCHKSYAEHNTTKYFEVLDKFVTAKMQRFSMREEYKKGSFTPYIKKILENTGKVVQIQNKYRSSPLNQGWSPWTPICENCGKIITPRVTGVEDGKVQYVCQDYKFEKYTAKGCGHKGENDPLEDLGKLMWKSEWASQWARWNVVSEGAGKEYQVPNSAFWINAEIVEKVLDFPMPVPIFYEHIMIDGVKMSASLGNVVYPEEWLKVASPEILRFFYNKKLMKTRSFSWKDLPVIYDDYDLHARVYFGEAAVDNEKEREHMKRLYEISQGRKAEKPIPISFSYASTIAQILTKREDIINALKRTGHYEKSVEKCLLKRVEMAGEWISRYAPDELKFRVNDRIPKGINFSDVQVKALKMLAVSLEKKKFADEELLLEFKLICKEADIKPREFFRAAYLAVLGKEHGPKLVSLILGVGQDKVAGLLGKL